MTNPIASKNRVEQDQGRARGGHARAERLTPERRSEISRQAAGARWDAIAEAICGSPDKPLRIGEVEIECYVLADGRRVLTQSSFLQALGRHRRPNVRRERNAELPSILQAKAIEPFITPAIRAKGMPITFKLPNGGRASGYDAELLPEVCEVYLSAREADALPYQQKPIAKQAEIIMRGLARVGIIALVDEATGYQEVRARDALANILEAFIAKELQAYVKTFPSEFYGELFRLRGLEYPKESVKRPQYFGHLTNDIVYRRLAPGVLDELKRLIPRDEKGRAKAKYFQQLTSNLGYPKLREHLGSVVTIMKLSRDWTDFTHKLDQIHPRVGDTIPLPFEDESTGL
jgi:P63C domain-containing protein